jgi:hypothetical protein
VTNGEEIHRGGVRSTNNYREKTVIAYLTHDEVNAALAQRIAGRLSLELTVLGIKDINLAITADLLLFDLDHLPTECKSELLSRAQRDSLGERIAVHSYCLTTSEARSLRKAGGLTARRLTATLLVPQAVAI